MAKKDDVLDWNDSSTGQWSVATGLHWLRDTSPAELAEGLWKSGIFVQHGALLELIAHGEVKKAILVARALLKAHPEEIRKSITEGFGEEYAFLLLDMPLKD